MPETMSPREKVAALKTNDPTNPAHRLASDLQAGHFAVGDARDDLIEVLSNLPRYASLASSGDHAELARRFHDTYERLAPSFGYETRPDTKTFDPESPNGRLMTAVCGEVQSALIAENAALRAEQDDAVQVIEAEREDRELVEGRLTARATEAERKLSDMREHRIAADLLVSTLRADLTEAERKLAEAVGHVKRLSDWIEHEVGAELPYAEGEEDARTFLSSKEAERG